MSAWDLEKRIQGFKIYGCSLGVKSELGREEEGGFIASRGEPGKSGLHASGEGERVIAPEPW